MLNRLKSSPKLEWEKDGNFFIFEEVKPLEFNINSAGEKVFPCCIVEVVNNRINHIELNWGKSDFPQKADKEELVEWISLFA